MDLEILSRAVKKHVIIIIIIKLFDRLIKNGLHLDEKANVINKYSS